MSKIGIYPGSFDPITYGHLDIIQRSLNVVDELIIAVSNNKSKEHLISVDDRLELINQSIQSLPKEDLNKIKVEKFDNLLVHYVKSKNASLIIMFNKICQVASLLSLLLSGSMAAFGYVAVRYMQSPEFERELKNKVMGSLQEKMKEQIPLQMPKMTSPAIPF